MIHSGDTLSSRGKVRFSHPINIDDVATDNTELKIVICHMGTPWLLNCQEVVYKNKNVYTDVSGLVLDVFNQEYIEYYDDDFRLHKIYWSSMSYVIWDRLAYM